MLSPIVADRLVAVQSQWCGSGRRSVWRVFWLGGNAVNAVACLSSCRTGSFVASTACVGYCYMVTCTELFRGLQSLVRGRRLLHCFTIGCISPAYLHGHLSYSIHLSLTPSRNVLLHAPRTFLRNDVGLLPRGADAASTVGHHCVKRARQCSSTTVNQTSTVSQGMAAQTLVDCAVPS